MKIVTREHSKVIHGNGINSRPFAPNGKSINPVSARAAAPQSSNARCVMGLTETQRREFLPIAAGRSETGSGLPERATSANQIILFYCVKGWGWCEIEGNRHEIMPGQMLVMPAKTERTYATYGEAAWSLIWIQLAVINTDVLVAKLNVGPQTATLGTWEKTQMLALFQEVLQALEMPCPGRLQQVSRTGIELLDIAISTQRGTHQIETGSASRIGRSIEYMKHHLNEPLRAGTLAGIANMSLPHYFALFKRVVGSSPIDYLIKLRMEHARRLLAETSWSVKEVAMSLGYDDPLYFSRVFKSVNQTAPSNFRARKRSANGG
jgi:AraC-like DNA-binding protein